MILLVPGFTLFMHVCSAPDSSVDRMSDTTEGSGVRTLNGKSGRGVGANTLQLEIRCSNIERKIWSRGGSQYEIRCSNIERKIWSRGGSQYT